MTRRSQLAIAVIATASLTAGCAGDGSQRTASNGTVDQGGSARIIVPATLPPTQPGTIPSTSSPTASSEPAVPTAAAPTTPPEAVTTEPIPAMGNPRVAVETVARFDRPIDLAVRPGDDRIFVVEQRGRIVRLGRSSATVLDLADRVSSENEQGLLGLAFDPTGTLAYVNYTDPDGTTVIAEFAVATDGSLDIATERVLLTVEQPFANHNGGDLEFGPDGMLYIALGDGGAADDPNRNASNPATLLGALLRIDPTPTADAPYTIPDDNPFAGGPLDGVAGAPEVWAWGLRNPWKFSFDPRNGDLWIPDVGQNQFEEINLVGVTDAGPAGFAVNFGWSAFEGTTRFNEDVADDGTATSPVLTYEHGNDGCSISGGVPYVGDAIPDLLGGFVYSDYCSGRLWALDLAGGRNLTLLDGLDSVTAVRTGPDGEIYIVQRSGKLLRLVAA